MSGENKKTILLVEDEVIIAMTEKMALEKYGYTVITTNSGEEAVEVFTKNNDIDLIIMDINLGRGIDGIQAAKIILKTRDIPLLFLSSHTEPEVVEKTEKITSYGYVVKNSSLTVLDASIKMAFKLFYANKQIVVSELKQKTMIANISDVIGIIGVNGFMKYKSPNIEKWFGWKPEDLVGTDGWLTVHPDDLERIQKVFYTLLEKDNSSQTVEYLYKCKDGSYKPISLTATNLVNDPIINGVLLNYHDISKQMSSIEKLQSSETNLKKANRMLNVAQHNAHIGCWIHSSDKSMPVWSDEMFVIFGLDPKKGVPTYSEFRSLIHPDQHLILDVAVNAQLTAGQEYSVELQVIQADGRERIIYMQSKIISENNDQSNFFLGTAQDITDRKLAEDEIKTKNEELLTINKDLHEKEIALKATEELYKSLFFNAQTGIFRTDINTGLIIDANDCVARFIGFQNREEMLSTPFNIAERYVDSKDREKMVSLLKTNGQFNNLEVRFKHNDGSIKWMRFSAKIVPDKDWMEGVSEDITEYKLAKNALQESEERFRSLVSNIPGIVYRCVNDSNWTMLYISQGIDPISDYPASDFINNAVRSYASIIHPDDRDLVDRAVQKGVLGKTHYSMEYRICRADGSIRWVHEYGQGVFAPNGNLHWLDGVILDQTERKLVENKIKDLLAEKELILKEVHHRIKNNIGSIESFLSLQAESTTNADVKAALQDAISRVQIMRVLYDKLVIGKDYQEVSIKDYFEGLIAAIVAVFPESGIVTIEKQITDFNLNTIKLIPLGIIINELLTNIFKYAFKDRDSGHISVSLDKTETHVNLTIQDNGNGIDEGVDLSKLPGFGLMIVRMLTEQLKGTYTIENYKGTRSILKFDI